MFSNVLLVCPQNTSISYNYFLFIFSNKICPLQSLFWKQKDISIYLKSTIRLKIVERRMLEIYEVPSEVSKF